MLKPTNLLIKNQSRTDLKFCSCSDDTTVKVRDFARCQEESSLTGGKDNLVKLWDPKSGRELCSFHGHKNTVLCQMESKWQLGVNSFKGPNNKGWKLYPHSTS
ncbi:hypothetical protein RIF29_38795 [Crotalaria pallida]|uniref:Uncharacterized protein n=1 Tax=Crotalaria pallida TaxID=3830 RepID=A0AAN9E0N2_CROPI